MMRHDLRGMKSSPPPRAPRHHDIPAVWTFLMVLGVAMILSAGMGLGSAIVKALGG